MKRGALRMGAWLVLAVVTAGCRQPTETIVVLDADEATRAEAHTLTVRICNATACVLDQDVEMGPAGRAWPLRITVVPEAGDAARTFALDAHLDDGAAGTQRAFAGFDAHEHLEVRRTFTRACATIACADETTCVEAACTAAADPSAAGPWPCSAGVSCAGPIDAGVREGGLPDGGDGGSPPDGARPDDAGPDGGLGDAGPDGALDDAGPADCPTDEPGTILLLPLDTTENPLRDIAGTANDATVTGALPVETTGPCGTALAWSGDSYATIAATGELSALDRVEIDVHVRLPDTLPSSSHATTLLSRDVRGDEDGDFALFWTGDGRFVASVAAVAGDRTEVCSSRGFVGGDWHRVRARFDGTGVHLFVDEIEADATRDEGGVPRFTARGSINQACWPAGGPNTEGIAGGTRDWVIGVDLSTWDPASGEPTTPRFAGSLSRLRVRSLR